MYTSTRCLLLLAACAHAFPFMVERDLISGSRTNDVICAQSDYQGNAQQPPPVVIRLADGSSQCGCASDIVSGGNGSYTECNQIYPVFGTQGYNDPGYRQNACYLDNSYVAACATSCTPNTSPNGDGTCSPTNPDSYSLQSPTTQYGTTSTSSSAAPVASPTDSWSADPGTTTSSSVWTDTTWSDTTWSSSSTAEESFDLSSEFVPVTTSSVVQSVASDAVPVTSISPASSSSASAISAFTSNQSSSAGRLSLGLCSLVLLAALCI